MSRIHALSVVCLFLALAPASAQETNDNSKLPVKRVVLYKNGVGYFEHLGQVHDNQDVAIPFTSGQLNDVLKTLTVLDLNGGRIAGVAYGSSAPLDRQLGDLRLPSSDKTTLAEFLGALRGTKLEARNGTSVITGRLLSVEHKTRVAGGTTLEVDYISLITDTGEIKTTEVSPAFSVRLLEHGLTGKVDRLLDLVSTEREADIRRMVVSTQGTGDRSLFVSYISEVPVWKATYRIVINAKGSDHLLQGWAIVDNTTGQDWQNIQLSLVAGAPQSFIQNLSQPYYSRRPVVPLPESVMNSPQTFEATLVPGAARLTGIITDPSGGVIANATVRAIANGSRVGEVRTDAGGRYEFQSLPDGPMQLQVEAQGFQHMVINNVMIAAGRASQQDATLQVGSTTETVSVQASGYPLQTMNTDTSVLRSGVGGGRMLGSGAGLGAAAKYKRAGAIPGGGPGGAGEIAAARATMESATRAQELGDLFEYKLKDSISIPKNRSALVPIVQSPIAGEKVSVWNESAGLPRPQRALWLNNSSGLTLDGGSFSVLEDETFAGEGIFDPIRPGEKRLISYATDLALNVRAKQSSEAQRVSQVLVSHGVMTQKSEMRESKTYTFRNEDSTPRTVIVEHPVRAGYTLRSEVQPAETSAGWMRFRVQVPAKQTASLVVDEVRPISNTYKLENVGEAQVALFLRERSINGAIEAALRRIIAQRDVIADLDSQKEDRDGQMEKIFDDQQRLRENMKALKGSAEEKALLQRYTQQLNDQENRLEALRKESAQLEAKKEAAQAALDKMIEDLSFDVKLT
ncbi:MAG TPA: carboxypeptidase regulatory-like domain-containing protein [Bryobacteraceae bacterium]|nr:carboxypeptidase regulatory-like domain-containing protein [Bryobacteraceae bacterium]